ncbi:YqaA family protein [Ahrensia sp. R2A130]|uniref:YqaA family protein n=1 Tax=Ahrensia sp. R2A130 TaxID=744979 RepID=UPI0001E0E100|nr:YqaA family protein [Ahrensia sp. R2A130]EFL87986.1 DedA family protein [Ahrensia sp. R2A130]
MNFLRPIYDWTLALAAHPKAVWLLALVAFAESSFFPIPPDVMLIPMIIAAPRRAFLLAGVATAASVAGGLFGYFIGAQLFGIAGQPLLAFYGGEEAFAKFSALYGEWGAWIVLAGGFTPLPFKVITIASGVTGLNIGTFLIASIVGRGARFFLVALLLWKFGPFIKTMIDRWFGPLSLIALALLIGGFAVLKLI